MGTDKAFVTLNGCTLLEHALDLAHSVTSDVRIVGNAARFAPFGPVVEDIFPDCGPLGGIHAALRASLAELNLILAVDTPFVSPNFMQCLIARSRESTAVATVPRSEQGWQPLCAVYRRQFADLAEKALQEGKYKIDALFDPQRIQEIGEEKMRSAGFTVEMFRNLNTAEELAMASGRQSAPHRRIT